MKLGTISDICSEQCNRVLANFKNDDWYHRLLPIKVFSQFICHVCNKIVQKLDGFYQFGISCNQSILFLFCKISDFKKKFEANQKISNLGKIVGSNFFALIDPKIKSFTFSKSFHSSLPWHHLNSSFQIPRNVFHC